MKRVLKNSIAALVSVPLLGVICQAEQLPELDCLVEPNIVVDIGSPEHGVVETISVDRSDSVSIDDVLAKLESSEQASAVRKANARVNMRAEVEAREATLAFARRKQERMRDLYASEAISSHQRDEVETELKMAQMQLQQARDARSLARIELDRAQSDLNRRTIRSPISGVIVERFVAPGEYVNEKPLMRVAQMHPLRIETVAPAILFGKIKPGMRARITAETHSDQVLIAEVKIVDRMIDPASGTFGIRLELPNPDYAIPSGLNCRASIFPQQRVATVTEATPEVQTSGSAKPAVDTKPKSTPVPVAAAQLGSKVESQPNDKAAGVALQLPFPEAAISPTTPAAVKTVNEAVPAAQLNAVAPTHKEKLKDKTATQASQPVLAQTPPAPSRAVLEKSETAVATVPEPVATIAKEQLEKLAEPPAEPLFACTTFGPLASDAQLDALLATLGADAREIGRREQNDEQTEGFFVATRAMATIAEAQSLSDLLKKFGINDLVVLPDGPTGGRVSLGLFAKWTNAKERHQKLAKLGIETEVLPHRLTTRQMWLDVELPATTLEWAPWKTLAPDVQTTACEPSLYVMAGGAGDRKNAK